MFKFYPNFSHSNVLLNQDHYSALNNDDPGATNNTSEAINRHLKEFATSRKKNLQPVFRTLFNYNMDHILGEKAHANSSKRDRMHLSKI